jgi:hypothetical protein
LYSHKIISNDQHLKKSIKYILVLTFLQFFYACNPTKKLLPNEFLVNKVEVINSDETDLKKENLEAFFRQKPNRKLVRKIHFFVWWYNLFDQEKLNQRRIRRNLKYDRINAERLARIDKKNVERIKKGKKPRTPKLKDKENSTFLESVRDIGEPAVVLDSILTEQTRLQLSKYLFSKGYFNNRVTDTIKLSRSNKRATVKYVLHPQEPYHVNKITYDLEDEKLGQLILSDTINSLLKAGMRYDEEKIRNESQRITNFALNNGYYFFENAYLNFNADSAFGNHTVSIIINLEKFASPYSSSSDSIVYTNHPRYKIDNVFIVTDQVYGNIQNTRFEDTLKTSREGTVFLLNQALNYRQKIILSNVNIYRNQYFRKDTADQTYKQLLGLGIFKSPTIQFFKSREYNDRLDCYIVCSPLVKQAITTQTEGTNTSGNLGIDGSIVYQNKNFAKGGELVELRLLGAISAQKQFSSISRSASYSEGDLERLQRTFNTVQFGPELSFSVPRVLFPFSLLPFKKDMMPRTYLKTSLNYQSRPEFSRVITNIDYGFSFRTNNNRFKHDLIPFETYLVRAQLLTQFKQDLIAFKDAFLINSFQDHITTLSRYGVTYTSKENSVTGQKASFYVRVNVQSSGNLLRKIFQLTNQQKDSLGRYLIFAIPFAQFVKTDIDLRVYIPIRKKSRVVYRVAGGVGKPLANLEVLPYEQSFFSGGPNSVRAWRARTLGPGSYNSISDSTRFDKIGDILLEANIEYRFHMIKSFNGALFIDAGNIWRINPDPSKPGAQFNVNSFLDQFAIGAGAGIRWDLNFFILRLDLAAPLKDPRYDIGNRWTLDKKPWNQLVLNFGIGYPF